ncbi:MAG: transglutaminase-like domain-containing protein, partial [Candidatus Omnitrophica bacterium]|nr:transglutaminase-like domain-containing protein [Candidatus Omnitrophota bacterium]
MLAKARPYLAPDATVVVLSCFSGTAESNYFGYKVKEVLGLRTLAMRGYIIGGFSIIFDSLSGKPTGFSYIEGGRFALWATSFLLIAVGAVITPFFRVSDIGWQPLTIILLLYISLAFRYASKFSRVKEDRDVSETVREVSPDEDASSPVMNQGSRIDQATVHALPVPSIKLSIHDWDALYIFGSTVIALLLGLVFLPKHLELVFVALLMFNIIRKEMVDLNNSAFEHAIAERARSIAAGRSTDYEKAVAIWDWIEKNIRYSIGMGGYYDASVQETLAFRRGLCFNWSLLFARMARSAGIDVKFRVIRTKIGKFYGYPEDIREEMTGMTYHVFPIAKLGGKWVPFDAKSRRTDWDIPGYEDFDDISPLIAQLSENYSHETLDRFYWEGLAYRVRTMSTGGACSSSPANLTMYRFATQPCTVLETVRRVSP